MHINFWVSCLFLLSCFVPGVFSLLNYDITEALRHERHLGECVLKLGDKKQTILSEAFQRANEVIVEAIGVLNMERYPRDVKWRTDRFKAAFGEHAQVEKVKTTFEKLQNLKMNIVKTDAVAGHKEPKQVAFPIVINWEHDFKLEHASIEIKQNFFNGHIYCKESRAHLLIATAVRLVLRTTLYVGRDYRMRTLTDLAQEPNNNLNTLGLHVHPMYPSTQPEVRGRGPTYPPMPLEMVGARLPEWSKIRDKIKDMENNPCAYWVYAALVSDRVTIMDMLRPALEAVRRAFTAWWKKSKSNQVVATDIEMQASAAFASSSSSSSSSESPCSPPPDAPPPGAPTSDAPGPARLAPVYYPPPRRSRTTRNNI